MDGCSIFRDQLAIRYPTHGHALWEPDPGGQYDTVEVGDVGFIRKGRFNRLFNALHPRNTTSNSDASRGLTYPPKLQPRDPNHKIKGIDNHRDFHSTSVNMTQHDTQAVSPDDIPLKFECSAKRGALLCLPFPAKFEETKALGDFTKWLTENIDSCFKVAEDLGYGVKREEIILVTGRHLAKSWISAAFSASHGKTEVSFTIRMLRDTGVHIEQRSASGELKIGPTGENPPENQCVFVQGYRVARIMGRWRLRAAGSVPDLHDPEPESDIHLESIGIPSEVDDSDPLHILLNYIAEQASNCDMILVHDKDLRFMGPGGARLSSDSLIEHIRSQAPAIRQVQCKLRNESNSGTGAEIATVATLSQDLIEEPLQDQNMPECPHPMDTTSGSDNEVSPSMLQENAAPQPSHLPSPMSVSPTDEDLSNVTATPALTASSHELPPDSARSSGPSIDLPQSVSRMDNSTSPFAESRYQSISRTLALPSSTFGMSSSLASSSFGMSSPLAPVSVNDIFTDGFLSMTFSPRDANNFFALLLGTPNYMQRSYISYSQGVWYVMPHISPSTGLPSRNVILPLDLNARFTNGTVVPQQRWTPADDVDIRRHVEEAVLQLPIFFVHWDGGVGFMLPDILHGHDHDLSSRDSEALLGGLSRTRIRINWPGYGIWTRQIPTRDETYARNPITLGRFMKHIATSVDKFFDQAMASGQVNTRWGIGVHGINRSQVKIIGAVHVSAGTWMPLMQLTHHLI